MTPDADAPGTRLHPLGLPDWRHEAFDAAVNELEGPLKIMGQSIEAADALATDRKAYEDSLAQWLNDQKVELDQEVLGGFPFPVAHCYRRYLKGSADSLRKLHAARDTAEAMIHVLHATVLGELRSIDGNAVGTGVKRAWVHTDTLKDRIELIRRVRAWGGDELPVSGRITEVALHKLDQLRLIRNEMSHRGELNAPQALELVTRAEPLLLEALLETRWLTDAQFVQPVSSHQVLAFSDHSAERDYRPFQASKQERLAIAGRETACKELFLRLDGSFFSLEPLLRPCESPDSHEVRVAFLKQCKNGQLTYEVFGTSNSFTLADEKCRIDLDALKQRFLND